MYEMKVFHHQNMFHHIFQNNLQIGQKGNLHPGFFTVLEPTCMLKQLTKGEVLSLTYRYRPICQPVGGWRCSPTVL